MEKKGTFPHENEAARSVRPTARKTIVVVDDHPMMRSGLSQLINSQPDMVVAGEADNPADALSLVAVNEPHLLLTDLTMPGRAGVEFIKDLTVIHPGLPILVVSMHDEMVYAERCLRAGARGYIMKEAGSEKLLLAIRRVLSGDSYVSHAMSERILRSMTSKKPRGSDSPIQKLSDREFEVFRLIGQGLSTRDVAERLHLSPKTVDVHRTHIREKLDLKDATALVRYAVRWVETQDSGA